MNIRKQLRTVKSLEHLDAFTRGKDTTVPGRLYILEVSDDNDGGYEQEIGLNGVYRTEQMDEHDQIVRFHPNNEFIPPVFVTDEMIALGGVQVLSRRDIPATASTETF